MGESQTKLVLVALDSYECEKVPNLNGPSADIENVRQAFISKWV